MGIAEVMWVAEGTGSILFAVVLDDSSRFAKVKAAVIPTTLQAVPRDVLQDDVQSVQRSLAVPKATGIRPISESSHSDSAQQPVPDLKA